MCWGMRQWPPGRKCLWQAALYQQHGGAPQGPWLAGNHEWENLRWMTTLPKYLAVAAAVVLDVENECGICMAELKQAGES
jgi:hypothetical protein